MLKDFDCPYLPMQRRQVEAQNHREMRRKTAQSLYNLSCHAGTESKIIDEGGMVALLSLASFDDKETNRYRTACFSALVVNRFFEFNFLPLLC
jgi:hypothetical protein